MRTIPARDVTCKTIFDCTAPWHMCEHFVRAGFREADPTPFAPGLFQEPCRDCPPTHDRRHHRRDGHRIRHPRWRCCGGWASRRILYISLLRQRGANQLSK